MLKEIRGLALGLLAATAMGIVFVTSSVTSAQASNKLVSEVPVRVTGNWFSNWNHMGKYGRKKVVTMHFTKKHADKHVWRNLGREGITLKQDKARHRLSKHALKLVTKNPNSSQFMLGHVGKSLWNKYYITKTKSGKTNYVTEHYWITAPIIHGIGTNDRMYTWTTTSTHKFNTQPLHGKHAVVAWKTVKNHGTWYTKTP